MKWKIILSCSFIVIFICIIGLLIFAYNNLVYPLKYTDEILAASEEFGVDKELIASIINTESHFNENALSNKGAVGLMQIMPSTAEWIINSNLSYFEDYQDFKNLYNTQSGQSELFNPSINIKLGTFYISYLIKKFNNVDTALCAYNAGEGKVKEWLNNSEYSIDKISLIKIPYNETRSYVQKVNVNLKVYSTKINKR